MNIIEDFNVENCNNCPLAGWIRYSDDFSIDYCYFPDRERRMSAGIIIDNKRPTWCPLKGTEVRIRLKPEQLELFDE